MRTTIDIDDEVLNAAKDLARRTHQTAGKVISELARKGLFVSSGITQCAVKNGFEVIPANGRVVSAQLVRQLMEEIE